MDRFFRFSAAMLACALLVPAPGMMEETARPVLFSLMFPQLMPEGFDLFGLFFAPEEELEQREVRM